MPASRLTGQSAKVPALSGLGGAGNAADRWTDRAEQETEATMRMRMLGALSAAAIVVATTAAGCGSEAAYDNASRPPAPINVAVALTNGRVQLSPSRVGAGPIVLLVSNQGARSQDVTLTAPEGATSSCVEADASSGPINPRGVARLPLDLVEGECLVGVQDGSLSPARLTVGPLRRSAQQDVLQP